MIIITGCSCVGKTTLAELLLKKFSKLKMVDTFTNREPRDDDFNYRYLTTEEIKKSIFNGEFEHLEEVYTDTFYGNKKDNIESIRNEGNTPLIVTSNFGSSNYIRKFSACLINLIPKHVNVITKRLLQNRPQLNLTERMEKIEKEMEFREGNVFIVNEIEDSVDDIYKLVENRLKDIEVFDSFYVPHICYIAASDNHNPSKVYKTYIGNEPNLVNGKIYQFHHARYSPNRVTPYKLVLVTLDNNEKYVIFEGNETNWK